MYLPFIQTNTEETESMIDTFKFFDQSISNESNSGINIWNYIWNEINIMNTISTENHQTWECFGEIESIKELMFVTDMSIAAIHLEKIKEMNNLSLLSEKVNY